VFWCLGLSVFLTQTKGEDLGLQFQVLPFCFQASLPDPDAAGSKVSRGSGRLAPDLFAWITFRLMVPGLKQHYASRQQRLLVDAHCLPSFPLRYNDGVT